MMTSAIFFILASAERRYAWDMDPDFFKLSYKYGRRGSFLISRKVSLLSH